ncbi:GDP-L-colitose synthase [subsurface metagenome]
MILVTGATGFLGKAVCKKLIEKNIEFSKTSLSLGCDLRNKEQVENLFSKAKPDFVLNCAAHVGSLHYVTTYAADVFYDNTQMALNIYNVAAKVGPDARIINPLANCSYPGDSDIQREIDWWVNEVHESVFSYGNAKRFIYVISKCYNKQNGLKSINFLIPNTFGPGDSTDPNKTHALNGIIIRMIKAERNGDAEFEVWGTGSPVREWAYIDDVVNIIIEGIYTKEDLIYPVNLAQNKGYSVKESAEMIADSVGFKGKLTFNADYQDGDPIKILDDKKFRQLFPEFQFFNHKKGIEETVKYYKSVL